MRVPNRRSVFGVLVGSAFLAVAVEAWATDCVAPSYREGAILADSDSQTYRAISISLKDFAPARLTCLAATLKQRHAGHARIDVLIFSDYDAAKYYEGLQYDKGTFKTPHESQVHSLHWQLLHLHSEYIFNADTHEEYVDLRPWGSIGQTPLATRINLLAGAPQSCRLQIGNRCVLAIDEISFPEKVRAVGVSGRVEMTGTLTHSGTIDQLTIAKSTSTPPGYEDVISQYAMQHLKTWTVEEGPRVNTFQMTYTYAIDPSVARGRQDVELTTPNHITVRVSR